MKLMRRPALTTALLTKWMNLLFVQNSIIHLFSPKIQHPIDPNHPKPFQTQNASERAQQLINRVKNHMKEGQMEGRFVPSSLCGAGATEDTMRRSMAATLEALGGPPAPEGAAPEAVPADFSAGPVTFNRLRDRLGAGLWGTVYRGECCGQLVAVKEAHCAASRAERRVFRRVVRQLEQGGVHLVQCLCSFADAAQPVLVTQLLRSDLQCVLHDQRTHPSLQERMKLAYDVARGLAWLHTVGIAHGGLQPRNVLLDDTGDWRLADCGLFQLTYHRAGVRALALNDPRHTYRYLAPEFVRAHGLLPLGEVIPDGGSGGDPSFSKNSLGGDGNSEQEQEQEGGLDMMACDIYSYGLLLYEATTGRVPYAECQTFDDFCARVMRGGARPAVETRVAGAQAQLLEIARRCWAADPRARPSADQLVAALVRVMVDSAIPRTLDGGYVSDANTFWREHFVAPVFRPCVPWSDVARYLATKLPQPDVAALGAVLCESPSAAAGTAAGAARGEPVMTMARWEQAFLWFGSWFAPDDEGEAVREDMLALFREPWFHGAVPLRTAEARIAVRDAGTFLVRLDTSDYRTPFMLLYRYRVLKPGATCTDTREVPISRHSYECSHPQRFSLTLGTGTLCENSVPRLVACLAQRGTLTTPCPADSDPNNPSGTSNPYVPGDFALSSIDI